MEQSDIENVLSLLAATVLADGRVFASEINTFLKAAKQIEMVREAKPRLSEAKLLSWYEMNKGDVSEKITTPYFKDWFYKTVGDLSHIDNKLSILNAMKAISKADGQVHVSERALVTLAARYWNIDFTA